MHVADYNAEKISPTQFMNELWRAAILDICFYTEFQKAMGCALYHRPFGDDVPGQTTRRATSVALYSVYFGGRPLSLTPSAADDNHNLGEHSKELGVSGTIWMKSRILEENVLMSQTIPFRCFSKTCKGQQGLSIPHL